MSDPAETPPAPDAAQPPDAAAEPPAPTPPPPTAEERIATLEGEVAQLRDRWLRAEAETQNQRARAERQIADARNYAIQKFARDVVESAENLRRGLDALPPPAPDESELLTKLRGGFEGVERSFLGLLERNGIARRDVQGETFDPEFHQAMAEQPATGDAVPGTVVQAWTPAWTLNGRLLKPAMVVVAAGAAGPPDETRREEDTAA